jgi:hypothetical protein
MLQGELLETGEGFLYGGSFPSPPKFHFNFRGFIAILIFNSQAKTPERAGVLSRILFANEFEALLPWHQF